MKKIVIIGFTAFALFVTSCKSKQAATNTNSSTTSTTQTQEASGENRPAEGEDPFVKMDINKDGLLTKEEAKGPIAKDFAKIDLDGDGIITRAEFDKAPKPQRGGERPVRK